MKISTIVALAPVACVVAAQHGYGQDTLYQRRSNPYLVGRDIGPLTGYETYDDANFLARRGFMSRMRGGMSGMRGGSASSMSSKPKQNPVQLEHVKPRPQTGAGSSSAKPPHGNMPMSNQFQKGNAMGSQGGPKNMMGHGVPKSPWDTGAPADSSHPSSGNMPSIPLHKAGPRMEFPRDGSSSPAMPPSPFAQAAQQPFE